MKKHFHHNLKEFIFKDVEALIYVFDVNTKSADLDDDLSVYKSCLDDLAELSPGAKVFVLMNKMDKIPLA
jgi:Ras-related GTP-binding protein A/B